MKRDETITVDLKVKNYDTLRLKQLDTTELTFKVLNNSLQVDLSNLSANLIFTKSNKTVVIQECTINQTENTIKVALLEDCVRISGKAAIEIELKEGAEVVSSFYIDVYIEKTSKEDIKSDNTETYIERFEKAIASLQQESQELLENISQAGATEIESIRQEYEAITSDLNELLANYNELSEYINNINGNISEKVNEQMSNYQLKNVDIASVTISKTTIVDNVEQATAINNGFEVILPLKYQVRKQFTRGTTFSDKYS